MIGDAEHMRVVGPDDELGDHRLVLGLKPGEFRFQGVDAVEQDRFAMGLRFRAPGRDLAAEPFPAGCQRGPYPWMPGKRLARVGVTQPLSGEPGDRVPCGHLERADGSGQHFDVGFGEMTRHVMGPAGGARYRGRRRARATAW